MNKKLFVPFVLAAVSISGCGTSAPQNGGTPAPVASAPAATYADAPEGCVKSTVLTAKTSDLKQITFTSPTNWLNLWPSTPEKGQLVFATFPVPKGDAYSTHDYADADARVVVYFEDNVAKKVGVGNYSSATDAKMKVTSADVSSKNLSGGVFDKNGSLEVTHYDSKYVCGTMKFDDGSNMLKGDFIAEIVNH